MRLLGFVLGLFVSVYVIAGGNNYTAYNSNSTLLSGEEEEEEYKLFLEAGFENRSAFFCFRDKEKENEFMLYSNTPGIIGVSATYSILSLSYSFNIKDYNNIDDYLGTTDYKRFDINIKRRMMWLNFHYSYYKGFYEDNNYLIYPRTNSETYFVQKPNLKLTNIGYFNYFVTNPKRYSIDASFDQRGSMKESDGSVVIMLADNFTRISDPNTIVKADTANDYFNSIENLQSGSFNSLIIGAGYGYTFVWGRWHFANLALVAPSFQIQKYKTDKYNLKVKFPLNFYYKSALSYQYKNFYFAASAYLNFDKFKFDEATLNKNLFDYEVKLGLRFFKEK